MKKKAIIFGLGSDWKELRYELGKTYEIVGISDNNISVETDEYVFIKPCQIADHEFDVVLITSFVYYEEMKDQLSKCYGIDSTIIEMPNQIRFKGIKKQVDCIAKQEDDKKLLLGKICLENLRKQWEKMQDYKQLEFKVFSQFGEDGIIQYLINNLTIENTTFIEFGVENYTESNTRFLLLHDNWSGFVIDGSEKNINYIKNDPIYWKYDLTAKQAFITKNNINELLEESKFSKNVGILSIDIDGNDYWVWEAIDVISPSIVICEYNALFGDKATITIPYQQDFQRTKAHYSNLYFGASLNALIYLAEKKGYTLVCTNNNGCNAFFVKIALIQQANILISKEKFTPSKFRQSRDEQGSLTYLSKGESLALISEMTVVNVITNDLIKLKNC